MCHPFARYTCYTLSQILVNPRHIYSCTCNSWMSKKKTSGLLHHLTTASHTCQPLPYDSTLSSPLSALSNICSAASSAARSLSMPTPLPFSPSTNTSNAREVLIHPFVKPDAKCECGDEQEGQKGRLAQRTSRHNERKEIQITREVQPHFLYKPCRP